MRQSMAICLICALLVALLCACHAGLAENAPTEGPSRATEDGGEADKHAAPVGGEESGVSDMGIPQTGWTQAVPAAYTQASAEQGNVVRLDYESEDYVRGGGVITKTAYVYTPCGYREDDEETRYNILYLMHG